MQIFDVVEPYIPGPQGKGGVIESATATQLPEGSQPTVELGGTPERRTLQLGIPAGDTGAPAAITGATVETLAPGSQATVDVGGTPDARTFKFGIPQGLPGDGAVGSVNGKTGVVVLDANDVGAIPAPAGADANRVYGTDASGLLLLRPVSAAAAANAIPLRSSSGQVTVPTTPVATTDAASKSYTDQRVQLIRTDMDTLESQTVLLQELFMSIRAERGRTGNDTIAGAHEILLFTAPFPLLITSVVFSWENPISISGTANSCNMRIVRRFNDGGTATNVVQLATSQQAIAAPSGSQRKAWSMEAGSWGTQAARTLAKDENLSWVVGSVTGTISIPLPVGITVGWRPVR